MKGGSVSCGHVLLRGQCNVMQLSSLFFHAKAGISGSRDDVDHDAPLKAAEARASRSCAVTALCELVKPHRIF